MKLCKMGRTLTVAVLLAMSLMFLSEQFSEQAAVVWAEVMPFTGAGVSVQGTHSGTGEIAKEGAKMSAIQAAQDQAGIYVSSLSVMKDSALSQDEIATIVNDVVRIDEKNIKYETSILGDSDVQVVKYRASVTVYIDTDSLKNNIDNWRQQEEKKRQFLVNAVESKRKSIEDLKQKFNDTETMIKQGADKSDIQAKLTEIEREILAIKKTDEGVALARKGDFQEAVKCFNEAIDIKDNYSLAYYNRGLVSQELKNYQQAIKDYNKAIELNPKEVLPYHNRGNIYLEAKKYQQAIADYNKAMELNPKEALPYIGRGSAYGALGKYQEAIIDFSKAIELKPKFAWPYINRGSIYTYLKKYQEAIDDYSKAIELNPNEVRAYIGRGNAYVYLKRHQQALDDYSKAIELNSKNVEAYYFRGLEYAVLRKTQQAIVDFNKVIELEPGYAKAYYTRGMCYKALGNTTKANIDFSKAEELGYKK